MGYGYSFLLELGSGVDLSQVGPHSMASYGVFYSELAYVVRELYNSSFSAIVT